MQFTYSMLIQWSMEDQKYVVSLPEFGPYAHTHGTTYDEALRHGQEVLALLIEDYQARNQPLPELRGASAPLEGLSAAQLTQIENLIDGFESSMEEARETLAWEKWQYLREHNQERDDQEPLSNEEIDLVCSFLTKRRLSRRLETEKQKVFISDDFNAPLPDEFFSPLTAS